MTNPRITGIARLASGALAFVDPATGKAKVWTCDWLVRVASGNPEPDSESDCWVEVECGAKVRVLDGFPNAPLGDAVICDGGHDRVSYAISCGMA